VVGEYHYADADLTKCVGNSSYPDMDPRFGYLHSFSFTENYVILPETGWLFDPCFYGRYPRALGGTACILYFEKKTTLNVFKASVQNETKPYYLPYNSVLCRKYLTKVSSGFISLKFTTLEIKYRRMIAW